MLFEPIIPTRFKSGAKAAADAIKTLDQVILAAHVNLDGDALGSLAAAGWLLGAMDKTFAIYSSSGVPRYLEFLPLPGPVFRSLAELPFEPRGAIYLDCGEASRLGSGLASIVPVLPSLNIDHHLGSGGLGTVANFVDPAAAATSQLMAYVAFALGQELKGDLAKAIALGLMTDTGGFCHGNTTAAVFALCALLTANGCPMTEIREEIMNSWSLDRIRLWGELFERLEVGENGAMAICPITAADLRRHHCAIEDLEGLVDRFRKIRGIRIAATVREENPAFCKFSLRSKTGWDVDAIAKIFGGGGHKNAAGGSISLPLSEALQKLRDAIADALARQRQA